MAVTVLETADLRDNILAASASGRAKLQDGFFSADATGRAKFASAFVTPTLADLTATWDFSSGVLRAAAPSGSSDVATKSYVDSAVTGVTNWKDPVKAVVFTDLDSTNAYTFSSTDGGTLTADANEAFPTIDGVSPVANSDEALATQYLLVGETGANQPYNGIWYLHTLGSGAAPWVLKRRSDANSSADVTAGLAVFATEGTTYGDTGWLLTSNDPITLNTTNLSFVQFTAGAVITAGDGLTQSGSAFHVNDDDSTLTIIGDVLQMKDAGTTFAKLATAVSDRLGGYDRREDFVGDGATTNFDLAVNDAKQTGAGIIVTKNGIVQKPGAGNDYTLSDNGGSGGVDRITFATAPGNPSNISVFYKRTGNAI